MASRDGFTPQSPQQRYQHPRDSDESAGENLHQQQQQHYQHQSTRPQQQQQQQAHYHHTQQPQPQQQQQRPLQPQSQAPPHGQLAALLRTRLDDGFQGGSGKDVVGRSSSAPPAQLQAPGPRVAGQNLPQDPADIRADPEYAAYFYTNSRLDPRLPPPIYAPGQSSWQPWQASTPSPFSGGNLESPAARQNLDAYQSAWSAGGQQAQQQQQPQHHQPYAQNGAGSLSKSSLLSTSSQLASRGSLQQGSPPNSPSRRKNLVDMIQEDFPRTPSPVFALQQLRQGRQTDDGVADEDAFDNSALFDPSLMDGGARLAAMTPPPGVTAQSLAMHSIVNGAPPRSSSTPPTMGNKLRLERDYVASPLQTELRGDNVGYEQLLQEQDEMLVAAMRQTSLGGASSSSAAVDQPDAFRQHRQPRFAPAPQQQALPVKQEREMRFYTEIVSAPPPGIYPPAGQGSYAANAAYANDADVWGRGGRSGGSELARLSDEYYSRNNSLTGRPQPAQQQQQPYSHQLDDNNGGYYGGNYRRQIPQQQQQQPHLHQQQPYYAGQQHQQQQQVQHSYPSSHHHRNHSSPSMQHKPMHHSSHSSSKPSTPAGVDAPAAHLTTRSPVLEEFRNSKNLRKFELRDVLGHVVEFSGDQHGSRFIQQKLETSSGENKQLVFQELLPNALQLMTDVFGNYVIQKFFEHGNQIQKSLLAKQMTGHVVSLSLQMYGCRVVQKGIEHVLVEQQTEIINELAGSILKCVKDQNGNHVIQKAIERVPAEYIQFLLDSFRGQIYSLATHPYGCRVMQRIFEHCSSRQTGPMLEELQDHIMNLVQDQYGNYVIQHILEKGREEDRHTVIVRIKGHILTLSKHKFASNVIEKCIIAATVADRQALIEEIVQSRADGTTPLMQMMKDQYANYVIQKILDVSNDAQRDLLISRISPHYSSLRKFTYGKHIIAKVEKITGRPVVD